jgi:hypothetical protein
MKNLLKSLSIIIFLAVISSCSTMQDLLDDISNSLNTTSENSSTTEIESSNSSRRDNTSSEWQIIDRRTTNSNSSDSRDQRETPITPIQQSQRTQKNRGDPDVANWDIAILDTAANVDYLTGIEKDVILEMNKVRTDPKKYAEL